MGKPYPWRHTLKGSINFQNLLRIMRLVDKQPLSFRALSQTGNMLLGLTTLNQEKLIEFSLTKIKLILRDLFLQLLEHTEYQYILRLVKKHMLSTNYESDRAPDLEVLPLELSLYQLKGLKTHR